MRNSKEELSKISNLNLNDHHVHLIIENAERNGISIEESAKSFGDSVQNYERLRTPKIRESVYE